MIRVASVVAVMLCAGQLAFAGVAQEDLKQREKEAKRVAKEAEALEKKGQLKEARARYVDALNIADVTAASSGLASVEEEITKRVRDGLKAAEKAFQSGKFDEAAKRLDDIEPLRPGEPTILYNRALVSEKLGRRQEALDLLARAGQGVNDREERRRIAELRTSLETGVENGTPTSAALKPKLEQLNDQLLATEEIEDVCVQLASAPAAIADSPAVLFNRARCAEHAGNYDEATKLMTRYLDTAPAAQDREAIKGRMIDWSQTTGVTGEHADEVKGLLLNADKFVRDGQYLRATAQLERAESLRPDLAEPHVRLARLYQARGDLARANESYVRGLAIVTTPAERAELEAERTALEERATRYNDLVAAGKPRMVALLQRVIVDGHGIGTAAGQRELMASAEPTQQAAVLVPLGADANALLGLIYLQGQDYPAARKAFSAVRDSGRPIAFYASAKGKPWNELTNAKVEIREDRIRLIGLSRRSKQTKQLAPLVGASSPDRLADLFGEFDRQGEKDLIEVPKETVQQIETTGSLVTIRYRDAAGKTTEVELQPFGLANDIPISGPTSRKFANPYTKLFRDFGGYPTQLGKESMTGGEKFGMVMNIAMAAYGAYGLQSMYGMYSSMQMMSSAVSSLNAAALTLQQGVIEQRRMLQGLSFKLVPTYESKPTFRTELFQ